MDSHSIRVHQAVVPPSPTAFGHTHAIDTLVSYDEINVFLAETMQRFGAEYGRVMLTLGADAPGTLVCCLAGDETAAISDGQWIEERVLLQRTPVTITSSAPLPYFADQLNLPGAVQLLAAPLLQDDTVIGTLSLGFTTAREIPPTSLEVMARACTRFVAQLPSSAPLALTERYVADLSVLYAQMPWAVLLLDETSHVLFANVACALLMQRDIDALPGTAVTDLFADADGYLPRANGKVSFLLLPDGTRFHVETMTAAVHLDDGHDVTIIVIRDISQEQQLLEERIKCAELDGISHTVATINHEINNPLFGLMATVQLLRSELRDAPPSVCKKLERIIECCERIQHTVDKLSRVIQPARRTYAASEDMLDLTRAMSREANTQPNE